MRKSYNEESEKLAKAIDIAIDSLQTHLPKDWEEHHLDHFINCYKDWKNQVLNPDPEHRTLSSLKYHIADVFTLFQESSGQTVEYFWKRINEEGLDYRRVNKLDKILKRGKIKGRIEYDYVTDMIVAAEQAELIKESERSMLSRMLDEFEQKIKK